MLSKKIKIGGLSYNIKFVDPHEIEGAYGEFDAETMSIKINNKISKQLQNTTILHEIVEAINYCYELKLQHNKITTLESVLFQILKENKKIFDEILK